MLSPNDLVLIATLAEAKSLTAAARSLGLTQPALTNRLHNIEKAVNLRLFARNTRGIRITEDGLAILSYARVVRDQTVRAQNDLNERLGGRGRRLRIALSHLPIMTILPEVIRSFRDHWPNIEITLGSPVYPDHLYGLREGIYDFALIPLPFERLNSEYSVRIVYSHTELTAIVRAGHPLRNAVHLSELAGAEWITPGAGSTSVSALQKAFDQYGLTPPRCVIASETLTALKVLVQTSDLIGLVPLEVHQLEARNGEFLRVVPTTKIAGPSLALVRWADAQFPPPAEYLANLLVEAAYQRAQEQLQKSSLS